MTDDNSVEYYRSREEKERGIAAVAVDPGVAAIHRDMADRYALLVSNAAPAQPILRQRLQM